MMQVDSSRSTVPVFVVLACYLVLVKLFIVIQPDLFRSASQAAVFEWPFLFLWIAFGLAGVLLAERAGFPQPLRSKSKVIMLPLILGILLGCLAIAIDRLTGWTAFVAAQMKIRSIHIDFPASLLIYPGGAIVVNIIYRIFLIPLLLWVISIRLMKGRKQEAVYWALAVITSLVEPAGDVGLAKFGIGTAVATFSEDLVLNLTESWLFRKFGFLAPILLRIHFYLIWHVLWGALQQF